MNSEVFLFAIRCGYLCSNHWNAMILGVIKLYVACTPGKLSFLVIFMQIRESYSKNTVA